MSEPGQPETELRFEQESENEALIFYQGPQVRTAEQLIELCGVDLAIWQQYYERPKAWQVHAKREIKSLKLVDGVSTGTVETGGIIVATLFSIEVRLIRREPKAVHPVIVPVISAVEYVKPAAPAHGGVWRVLIAGDAQIGFTKDQNTARLMPFHSRAALDLLLQIAGDAKPDAVYLPGDWFDLAEWSSKFIRRPEFGHTTQAAIYEGHLWLAWLRALLPDTPIYLFEGNHEQRMPDAIAVYMPWAYDLRRADAPCEFPVMSIPYLVGLERLGIEWVPGYPDAVCWLNDRLLIEHGTTTKLRAESHVRFRLHDHRLGWRCRTIWGADGPELVSEFDCGYLATTEAPGRGKREDWQNGFAVVDYEKDGPGFDVDPVVIEGGAAVWGGLVYRAVDRLEELRRAYPGLNW